jgi:hypothetical protein
MGSLIPRVGDLYFAAAHVLTFPDPRRGHPVVVVEDASAVERVMVIGRTSNTTRFKGLAHPAAPQLGLDLDGVFALRFYQSISYDDFTDEHLEYRGQLDTDFLDELLDFVGVTT